VSSLRWFLLGVSLCGCGNRAVCAHGLDQGRPDGRGGNVLIVLLDDLGVDKIGAWDEHPVPGHTPNIDAFADSGVRFQHAFAQPVCSPGRAALLTGRSALRTGIGSTVRPTNYEFDLPADELTIPEMLQGSPTGPWSSAAVGKWHLSRLDDAGVRGGLDHGFDRFLGMMESPGFALHPDGDGMGYFHWEKSTDGELSIVDEYLVTTQTDDALEMMATLPEPWVIYLAYSAVHWPIHTPPEDLWSESVIDGDPGTVDAMLEAVDAEFGRLMKSVDDRTTVVLTADNGTESFAVREPAEPDRSKDTLYDGGVRVPMAVSGYAVDTPGTVVDALVHLVDVFATVADIAGVELDSLDREIDGISLLPWLADPDRPGRDCLVIDRFPFNGEPKEKLDRSIRDDAYLLVLPDDGPEELYERFDGAPWHGRDLLGEGGLDDDAERAYERLKKELERAVQP
jgi:arylsulfatase A-like enzyme